MCIEDHIIGCQASGAGPVAVAPGRILGLSLIASPRPTLSESLLASPKPAPGPSESNLTTTGSARHSIRRDSSSKMDLKVSRGDPELGDKLEAERESGAKLDSGARDRVTTVAALQPEGPVAENSSEHAVSKIADTCQTRAGCIAVPSDSKSNIKGEIKTLSELLDSPRYWYDSRIVSGREDTPRDTMVRQRYDIFPFFECMKHNKIGILAA